MAQNIRDIVVYIVEDDDSVRKGLSRLMRSVGVECRAYPSAENFLEQAPNDPQGCILLDLTMSHMNGLELARALKERGVLHPIIVLSAIDDEEIRQSAHELGVRFFLRKPVDDQALIDTINWVIAEPAHS
jgi:FixJ family two-component response regulator